jgi:hypothetical protein
MTGPNFEIYGPFHPEHLGEAVYELESDKEKEYFSISKFKGLYGDFLELQALHNIIPEWSKSANDWYAFEMGSYFWESLGEAYDGSGGSLATTFWQLSIKGNTKNPKALFLLAEFKG